MATLWRYDNGALVPVTAASSRIAQSWPDRHEVTIEVKSGRNLKFHRMFFAFCNLVCDAVNRGPFAMTTDELIKWLKVKMGYAHTTPLPPNLAKLTAQSHALEFRSISFAKMDQTAFYNFASEASRLIETDLAAYIVDAPEWPEIKAMIDGFAPEIAA